MVNKLQFKLKAVGCLFFALLLCILPLLTTVQAQPSFSGSILIREEGSVEPSSAPIQRSGETYTLLSGFTGNITIQKDNIVLDGAGFGVNSIVTGTETTIGVDLSFRNGVTVTNLQVSGFVQGIHLLNSTSCTIIGNNITDNIDGIRIDNATNNSIIGNNVTANRHGVHPYQGNVFYHNNFVNSSDRDVFFDSPNYTDTWDYGYPSGGNYWSNYTSIDEKKGPSQTEAGSDGIGDSPQILSSNNTDGYPLMVPYVYGTQPTSQQTPIWIYVTIVVIALAAVIVAFFFLRKRRNLDKK